jgi:HSP20 family protein
MRAVEGKKPSEHKILEKRESEREMSRSRGWEPLLPAAGEFFSSSPFSLVRRFHAVRAFGRFFGHDTGLEFSSLYPAVEVLRGVGNVPIRAELPGLKPEDVRLEVVDDQLILQGEGKEEHEEKKGKIFRSERRYGKFYREFALPRGADAAQAKARFQDGVLEISMPLPQEKSSRRSIPVAGATNIGQKT